MEARRWSTRLPVVGLVVGVVVGGALAFAGVTFAGNAPPTSISTCVKANHHGIYGKPKLTTGVSCSGGAVFQTWSDAATVQKEITALSNYKQLLIDSNNSAPASFAGMDFSTMALPAEGVNEADFTGANFTDTWAQFTNWGVDNFTRANFTGADLVSAVFFFADNFTNANLTDADLTSASFVSANMTGVTYSNTTCPNGTNSGTPSVPGPDGDSCAGQGGGL